MINVVIKRNKEGKIYHLDASGHAYYAPSGFDIVCAAVSALIINTSNSIEALTEDDISAEMDESTGALTFDLKTVGEKSSLLLESLLFGLNGIAEGQGDFVSVTVEEEH